MSKKPYNLIFGTLANQQRLAILNLLRRRPCNVTEISSKLEMNQTTVSHNLAQLRRCGFVSVKQNGKERVYTLNGGTIEPLLKLIDAHMRTYCQKQC